MTEAELLSALVAAGARFDRVVITRNRRVLVSLGERGRALRLHACFLGAPSEVVAALAALYSAHSPRDRSRARTAIRAYLDARRGALSAAAVPPRRRIRPADREHVDRLVAEFERVNREHFGSSLPSVPIAISGRMRRRNGHFSTHPLEIVISRRLLTDAREGEAEHTLRHEMIHLWQHVSGRTIDHGRGFRTVAERIGVHPRATRSVQYTT